MNGSDEAALAAALSAKAEEKNPGEPREDRAELAGREFGGAVQSGGA